MGSKRTKALAIPDAVKREVFERDGGRCILCGAPGSPWCHYISRAQGGLGIKQNIVTLCDACHKRYDQTADRTFIKTRIADYLKSCYPGWNEAELVYQKGMQEC